MSAGKITSNKASNYIGSVVGSVSSSTTITHCYWTSDVGCNKACGYGNPSVDTVTSQVSLNTATVNNLNSYNSSWAKWFMLRLNGGSVNSLNQTSLVATQKHFPGSVKEGNTFLFWCLDIGCNEKYDPNTTNITKVTELYAVWAINNYTLTFDFGNGTVESKTLTYNETIIYPKNLTREECVFNGWVPNQRECLQMTPLL